MTRQSSWPTQSVIAAIVLMLAETAHATMLTAVQGGVLVDQGNGYEAVKSGMPLKAGDAIMVQPGGAAQIFFADGCQWSAVPGAALVVSAQSPCATRAAFPKPSYSGVYDPQNPREAPPLSEGPAAINPVVAIIGGAALVGGAIAIMSADRSNKRGSASP